MRVIAVDDEPMALRNLELKLEEIPLVGEYHTFEYGEDALEWLSKNSADAAFLDINMEPVSGIEIAQEIKKRYPDCAIIFLTGYSDYAVEAFSMKVSGYLVKPVSVEDLERELTYAEEASKIHHAGKKALLEEEDKLKVQCFGNFEVFKNGEIVKFSRVKSKEVFAFLVDRRGASSTMAEIGAALWDDGRFDRSRNNQIHSFLHELVTSLEAVGVEDVVIRKRNAISINREVFDCDYYRFLEGDSAAISSFMGEYMSQYWWAEYTVGELMKAANKG